MWIFFKPESAPLFYSCFQTTHQQARFFMLKNMIFIMIKSQRYPWSVSGWVSNVTQRVFRVLAQFQIVKREHMKERLNKMVSSFEQITQDFSWTPTPHFRHWCLHSKSKQCTTAQISLHTRSSWKMHSCPALWDLEMIPLSYIFL